MNMPGEIIAQHLIDPELCIRCNTCEETCPSGAISNDGRNYVVDVKICNACKECVKPCPTGAINVWRSVNRTQPYTLEQQFGWDVLPEIVEVPVEGAEDALWASRGLPAGGRGPGGAVENLYTQKHSATAIVRENTCVTAERSGGRVHHIVLDLSAQVFPFVEGQSVGVIAPGGDADGKPHLMRLYSVACPREGEGGRAGHLALTVKRVVEDHAGAAVRGVCSNYLCDLQVGASVSVAGPFGVDFLMPEDDGAPVLMICTGTGVAPMRAMIQRRRMNAGATSGPQMLFYGARTPAEMAYHGELVALEDSVELNFAFSRQPGQPRRYVQDAIRASHDRVASLLADSRTHVYLCGLRGMESGVFEALQEVCKWHGLDGEVLTQRMRVESRLHVETY